MITRKNDIPLDDYVVIRSAAQRERGSELPVPDRVRAEDDRYLKPTDDSLAMTELLRWRGGR